MTTSGKAIPPLVSADWLERARASTDLVILDASFHLPTTGRNGRAEFEEARIPGARFFDVDTIADPASPLPHMLPSEAVFEEAMAALGVSDSSMVVVYDWHGLFSAARAWWMLRAFGHSRVALLDGGMKKWREDRRPLESGPAPEPPRGRFTAHMKRTMVKSLDDMRDIARKRQTQVLDARSSGRFAGTDPEPRPGLPSGHIPGSVNLPFGLLSNPDGTVKPPFELRLLFQDLGINLAGPIVTTCGSGVSACNISFALFLLGYENAPVYDGSWSEWGALADTPKGP